MSESARFQQWESPASRHEGQVSHSPKGSPILPKARNCGNSRPKLTPGAMLAYNNRMPLYGVAQAGGQITSISPGDEYWLFKAESLTAPQASVAFARGMSPSMNDSGVTFLISYAAAPTATLAIQASNIDLDAQYQTIYTSANLQLDNFSDTPPTRWKFYRAKLLTQSAGGAVTVLVQR